MADPVKTEEKDLAPHGRDENGVPLAPYGLNLDGTPRKSNRGARPGQPQGKTSGGAKAMKPVGSPKKDAERKAALLQLVDALVIVPMIGASVAPPVVKRLGEDQAEALAADAYILRENMPALADGLIVLSQSKPGVLSWLDQAEENAPYLALAMAGVQLSLALVSNHRSKAPEALEARRGMAQAARAFIGAEAVQARRAQEDALDAEAERFAREQLDAEKAAQEAATAPVAAQNGVPAQSAGHGPSDVPQDLSGLGAHTQFVGGQ